METFYLVDFENVHNEGLENIASLKKEDHIHIFSTENALNIRMDIIFSREIDIEGHIVPVRKQSLDMHLVSYLGHLLGKHGKKCSYVIISKDTDYDNIIKFWKEEGYQNISRKQKICESSVTQKKITSQITTTIQAANSKIQAGMAYNLSGNERSELNQFMQHGLLAKGYSANNANSVCKYVVAHCNDERMLNGIHNDLRKEFDDYSKIYEDVKLLLGKFVDNKNKSKVPPKRESQVRSFFGQHFKKKIYVDKKEKIISIILNAQTRQQVNNNLLKLYSDGNVVKHIYQTIQPIIKDLPGK